MPKTVFLVEQHISYSVRPNFYICEHALAAYKCAMTCIYDFCGNEPVMSFLMSLSDEAKTVEAELKVYQAALSFMRVLFKDNPCPPASVYVTEVALIESTGV